MPIPGPRDTIVQSPFDTSTRGTLLSVFDQVWMRSDDRIDLNGYRLAASILDAASKGLRLRAVIEAHVLNALGRLY
jgi:hypothetical protein